MLRAGRMPAHRRNGNRFTQSSSQSFIGIPSASVPVRIEKRLRRRLRVRSPLSGGDRFPRWHHHRSRMPVSAASVLASRREPPRSGSPSVSGRHPARNPARNRSRFRGPSTRHRTIERDYERDYDCRCECRRSSPIIGSDGADHYPTRTPGSAAVLRRQEAFVTFFLFVAVVPRFRAPRLLQYPCAIAVHQGAFPGVPRLLSHPVHHRVAGDCPLPLDFDPDGTLNCRVQVLDMRADDG